jgi:pyrimidine deaminase RibD-like protein
MNLKELHSFKLSDAVTFHNELNPKLWHNNLLRPEVKKQLKIIADDFLQELGISGLDVKDITISGSNAAYSYTKHSDLDLHILVDMGELPDDEVYRELFDAKKTIYNDMHDIKIHGIPVELYVQDSREPVISLGEYSIMDDDWKRIPTKRRSDFDQTATKQKYNKILNLIEIALQSRKYSKVKHIIDTIKRYRQAGLDKGGEFGPENLAFKMLRSQGYITKLYDLRDKLHSEILTVETMYQNIDESNEEKNHWYDAGVRDASRGARPNPRSIQHKLKANHPEEVYFYMNGYKSVKQGVAESENNDTAISLSKLGKFHPGADALAEFVPERASAQYALHPDKWESTFYSLTNKDSDKLRYYGPKKISIPHGTLVGDMAIANKFYRAKTSEEKQQYANAYKASLQSYPVDVSQYRMPELLIPRQNVDEAFDTNDNSKLDEILYKLCNIVKKEIKEKTGEHAVAACIIDPDNRIVAKTSKDKHGRWIHAEHNAIDTYEKKYGEVSEGSIIVTTLSPCNEYDDRTSDERFGESCTDYINSKGIKKVYCGYMDPTQDNYNREFDVIETSDNDLRHECKKFADTFLKNDIEENYTMQFAAEKTPPVSPYAGVKDNQYRGGISEATQYKEIEFVCANPEFPDATDPELQQQMYQELKKLPGVIPLFQDQGHYSEGQKSLTAIFKDADVKRQILKLSKSLGVTVDLIQPVSDRYVDRAIRGEHEGQINEASGYIPSEKEKNDPRFKTALTVDVHPDSIKKNAKAFYWNTSRAGIPPTANPNGKI